MPESPAPPSERADLVGLSGLATVWLAAAWLWVLDVGCLLVDGIAPRVIGGAALLMGFIALSGGALLGVGLGAVVALRRLDAEPSHLTLTERLKAWLLVGDRGDHGRRIAAVMAVLALLSGGGFVAYRASHALVLGMAQPHFIALSVVGMHIVVGAVAALLFRPTRNGLALLVRSIGTPPGVGWLLASVARFVAFLSVVALVIATYLAVQHSYTLSFLPWASISKALAATLLATVSWQLCRRQSVRRVRLAMLAAAVLNVLAIGSALVLGPGLSSSRVLAEERTLTGALGYRVLRVLLDRDGDGHLHVLGGGDCAPDDPAIHPGATDLPENGIDEDCDGDDLTARAMDNPTGYRFAVPAAWPRRPSIVLVTVDAFAATRMAAFGNTHNITPRIDALARQAALFRQCFAQGPSTRLSFPSMFTSRWDSQIAQRLEGKHPYPIDSSELMLAEVLNKAGYDTAAVLPDPYFDPGHWKGITDGFRTVDTAAYRGHRPPHNARKVTDQAIAQLDKARTQPLFLWVHYYDAHSPHQPPEGSKPRGRTTSDAYDAELSLVDREVGRLLDAIDGDGRAPTAVVLTADHGIDFTPVHHDKFNYGYDLYTSVLHVPLIIRVPGATPVQHDRLVSTMDIAPTLVNLLGLSERFPYQGVSLVREIAGTPVTDPRRLIHQFYIFEHYWRSEDPLEKIALRTEQYNLIHDRKLGRYELYDWTRDYYEAHDLTHDPDHADALRDLRKQLAFYTYSLHRRPAPVPGVPARRR